MSSRLRCFISGCKTGYPSDRKERIVEGKKCLGLFCVQRDEGMLEKWKKAIPQTNKEFRWTDSVCEKHFHEDNIERFYIVKLPDGSNQVLERKVPKLKPKAVPTIFPNLHAYKKRKAQVKHNVAIKEKEETSPFYSPVSETPMNEVFHLPNNVQEVNLPSDVVDIETEEETSPFHPPISQTPTNEVFHLPNNVQEVNLPRDVVDIEAEEETSPFHPPISETSMNEVFHLPNNVQEVNLPSDVVDIEAEEEKLSCEPTVSEVSISEECYLADCIKSVILPSHLWTIHSTSNNFVICAKWNEKCVAERRVVIKDDLSITVFIQNCELEEKFEKIKSVNELSLFLKKVNRYVACAGIDLFSRICQGYVPFKSHRFPGVWCDKCKIERRLVSQRRVRYNFNASASLRKKRLYHKLVCDQREYASLKEEVNDLRKKIEYEKAISVQLSKLDEI